MRLGLLATSFIPVVSFNVLRESSFMTSMHNRSPRQPPPSRKVQMNRPSFKPQSSHQGRKSRYYAVRTGKDGFRGILNSWDECKRYVNGVSNAVYKSFKSILDAQEFIRSNGGVGTSSAAQPSQPSGPDKFSNTSPRTPKSNTGPSPHIAVSNSNARNSNVSNTRRTSSSPTTGTNTPHSSHMSTPDFDSNNRRPAVTNSTVSSRPILTAPPPRNPPPNRRSNTTATASTNPSRSTSKSPATPRNSNGSASKKSGSGQSGLFAPTCARDLYADSPLVINEAPKELIVYTDGACFKNGSRNARAGYGVYFGLNNPYNISAPLKDSPTNQRAEMTAVLEAMKVTLAHGLVANGGKLTIYTDSQVCFNPPIFQTLIVCVWLSC